MKSKNLDILKKNNINVPYYEVIENIEELNNKLLGKSLFSVRSNSELEDSANKSYAGQFNSYLNVERQDLDKTIKLVKDSYRKLGDNKSNTVIVQEMINSDLSGVIFTANPIGILNEMVITVGEGLGENIVEDKVDTTSYYYNKDDNTYYYDRHNGSVILNEKLLEQLVSTAKQIEDIFNTYVDIEFSIKNDRIYILQTRPITTLKTSNPIILDNSNIVESYPGVSLPLTEDFAKEIYYRVFKSLVYRITKDVELVDSMDDNLRKMVDSCNGRIYYRINNWYNILRMLPMSSKIIKVWQNMLGVTNKEIYTDITITTRTKLKVLMSFINLLVTCPKKMNSLNTYFDSNIENYRQKVEDCKTIEDLITTYEFVLNDLANQWDITLVNDMYTFIFTALSGKNGKAKLSNIKNLKSMEPAIEFNKLIECYKDFGIGDKLSSMEKDYINNYGDRCPNELKLETITYRTNPELLREHIIKSSVIETCSNNKDNEYKGIFIKRAKLGISNREISRLNRTKIFGITRDIMIRIGKKLCELDYIEDYRDVMYLNMSELNTNTCKKDIVRERKELYKNYSTLPNASRLVFDIGIINKNKVVNSCGVVVNNKELSGTASSVGRVTGEVIVIEQPDISIDTTNKIIVCKSTDPGWVFLIKNCIGIIAERGSLLSHTAIISRELNKPAIVNVDNATRLLSSGDRIELDAINEKIKILGE